MSTILCYIYPDMADFEVIVALHRLRNAGKRRIITVADTPEEVVSQSGLRYVPDMTLAEAAAIEVGRRMGLQEVEVISREIMQEAEGTRVEIKGRVDFDLDVDHLVIPEEPHVLTDAEIRADIERKPMTVVCGTVGNDEHSVGLREIIDIKHGGIEKYGIR